MAIQLPTLQRMDAPASSPEGRLDARAPSADPAFRDINSGINNIANSTVAAIEKFEKDALDTEVTNAANEYAQWYNRKMYGDSETGEQGLTKYDGNPTELYNRFDQEAAEKRAELLGGSKLSAKGQAALTKALSNRHNSLYASRLVAYGSQYDKYEKGVYTSAVEIEKQKALDDLQFVKPGDKTSLIPIQSSVNRIQQLRLSYAKKKGLVQEVDEGSVGAVRLEDGDGSVSYVLPSESVELDMIKDASESYTNIINSAIASSDYERSKMLLENFGSRIDPFNKAKLDRAFEELEIKNAAHIALSKADGKSFKEQRSAINSLTPKELKVSAAKAAEIKLEARKLIDTNERYIENMDTRRQKRSFQYTFNVVGEKMRGDDPYVNVYEMENDPKVRGILKSLTPSQQKTIYELAAGKDVESDPQVRIKMDNMVVTEDFYLMDAATMEEQMVGLSKADKETFRRIRREQNKDPASRSAARAKRVFDAFDAQYDKKAARVNGRLTPSAEADKLLLRSEVSKRLGEMPLNTKPEEIEAYAEQVTNEFIARRKAETSSGQKVLDVIGNVPFGNFLRGAIEDPRQQYKGKEYVAPFPRKKAQGFKSNVPAARTEDPENPIPAPQSPQTKSVAKDFSKLSSQEKRATVELFIRDNGRPPKNMTEVREWWKKNGK